MSAHTIIIIAKILLFILELILSFTGIMILFLMIMINVKICKNVENVKLCK